MPRRHYRAVKYAATRALADPLDAAATYLLALMLRNVSTDGFVIADPAHPGSFSMPGCIIASPSYQANLASVDQNYVYNWTRDAAVTAIELAVADLPTVGGVLQTLVDYVTFAATCQIGAPRIDRACYTVEGGPRDWTNQSDGPALQTSAVLKSFTLLDDVGRTIARDVIGRNITFLLENYQAPTYNLWEEVSGHSFFARSVQIQCFADLIANSVGIPIPSSVSAARDWLLTAIDQHWNGSHFVSVLDQTPGETGYDPNIDIVLASLYGAVPPTDTRILATAALLRQQWSDPASTAYYPINGADAARGIGPMLGRYPGDKYDGDVNTPVVGGHPWSISTSAFADLYYRVAAAISAGAAVPLDSRSAPYFAQVGVGAGTSSTDVVVALKSAGDRMLSAILFHSDHFELSEQFDGTSGYEKSVSNLTWSYAGFLSAVRSRRQL